MQILNSSVRHTNKQNSHSSPNKELQRVRIQLNDRIFQYHKLQQDTAQEKAKMFIEFQKERGNLMKTIKELRQKNVNDNEEWTKKIDQLRKQQQQALSLLIQKYEMKMQRDKNQLKQQIQATVQSQFQILKNKVVSERLEWQSKLKKCEIQKQNMIQILTNSAKKKQIQKEKQYTIFIEGLKKQNELKVNQLKSLYLRQEQQRKRLTKELQEKFKDYVKQKIIHQGINNQQAVQIERLLKEIEELKRKLEEGISKQIEQCEKHKKQMQESESKYKNQLIRIQNESQIKSKRIFGIFDQEIQRLGVQIATLQRIHKQKQLLWEERGKKILLQYEKRESKKQDLKAIQSLQVQLIKRDFLLQREKKQLKHCKLQLQNMQQIYDKMFMSNNYLAKLKAKSFKVKKLKTSILMNSSNRSTIMQNKKCTLDQR